jgi:hypothetical protein
MYFALGALSILSEIVLEGVYRRIGMADACI